MMAALKPKDKAGLYTNADVGFDVDYDRHGKDSEGNVEGYDVRNEGSHKESSGGNGGSGSRYAWKTIRELITMLLYTGCYHSFLGHKSQVCS